MSVEKARDEAVRWLGQARADLKAARPSLAAGVHEWSCFQAQQAAEKALKAFWYHNDEEPWGHSTLRLIEDYPDQEAAAELVDLADNARVLDKLYIPTRYPSGLPDSIPAEVYTRDEAAHAIDKAREIVSAVARLIEETSGARSPEAESPSS